jgi:outer membrane protein TolC
MTVDEAVAEALRNHPALGAAGARLEQAEAALRAVWDAYLPQVSVFGGLQQNEVRGSTTTTTPGGLFGGSQTLTQRFSESDTRFVAGGGIEQFLFDFGGFGGRQRAAEAARRAQRSALETQRLDVALNAKVAYYRLLRANRLLRYNQETVGRRQSRVERIAELVRRGLRDRKDLLQAQLDLAAAELNYARSRSDITEVEAAFLDALGQKERTTRQLVDDVSLKPIQLTLEQAVERALTMRPELEQARASIEAQQAQIDAVRASYWPQFSAFAQLASLTPVGSSDLDQLTVATGGVSVSLPTGALFSRARLDQAEASLAELRSRHREIEQAVVLDVNRTYTALFEAVERTRITRKLAAEALANFEETQSRYRRGQATITESTDAYTFLYDARVKLIEALYDAKIAEARLERAVGGNL